MKAGHREARIIPRLEGVPNDIIAHLSEDAANTAKHRAPSTPRSATPKAIIEKDPFFRGHIGFRTNPIEVKGRSAEWGCGRLPSIRADAPPRFLDASQPQASYDFPQKIIALVYGRLMNKGEKK
jgi:hypothetical protein